MNRPPIATITLRRALELLGTALVYGVVGWLSLQFAVPTRYATPFFPAAGIALACVIAFGARGAWGVALGALGMNLTMDVPDAPLAVRLAVPFAMAAGSALQAVVAERLLRRAVRQPIVLNEPRDIAAFCGLGAFVACIVGATIGTATLGVAGLVAPAHLAFNWLSWWTGDALGTLIAAPVALTLVSPAREDWAPRRVAVGLTLTVVTVLMASLLMLVARWDDERVRAAFEREAAVATSAVASQMQEPLHALEALRGIYVASVEVGPEEMRRAARTWLEGPAQPLAIGFAERLPPAQAPAEATPGGIRDDDGDNDPYVVSAVTPDARDAAAVADLTLSLPATRPALRAAVRTDRPAVTAGFALPPDPDGLPSSGVLVYQAIYQGSPQTMAERLGAARGVVFVALRLDETLRAVRDQLPHYLQLCVVDTDPLARRPRLSGPIGCEAQPAPELLHVRPLAFAGRQWDLRVSADPVALRGARSGAAWPFAAVGLLATTLLSALLLTVTGRARRIELAVRERTAALTQEVRERENAEAALRGSERRFRNILNNVPIGICYTDLAGNVKQANPRFCQLLGYDADELARMTFADFTHPDDVPHARHSVAQLIRGDIPLYRRQQRYVDRAGRTIWVQATLSLLRNEDGAPWRIVATVEDITEHLRLAEAERAREAAEAANRAKSDFLSRMSHELRTPLNAMLGFAQLLELDRRHPIAEAQRPWVAQIQQAGWHLLEMINDVLDLSRIESGNVRLAIESLDVGELLDAAVTMVAGDAARRGIAITRAVDEGGAAVRGDATRVKQVLINLLSNAVKYNVDGGRIHVLSRAAGEAVEIVVADTGLGMTPEQLAGLFQPFNRLGRERSAQEGTGIGLVISKRLAELMGGSLAARSAAGEGSSFILQLPAVNEPRPPREDAGDVAGGPAAYHRRHVHYVEDNATNVEVMRGILAQRPQVVLDVSVTGLDGLAAIRAGRPDVVLLDMHLPDIDGLDLLRHLRQDPATADIPVVIVSADATPSQMEAARAAGALRYLTKPVSVPELLAVLDEVLDEADTRFG